MPSISNLPLGPRPGSVNGKHATRVTSSQRQVSTRHMKNSDPIHSTHPFGIKPPRSKRFSHKWPWRPGLNLCAVYSCQANSNCRTSMTASVANRPMDWPTDILAEWMIGRLSYWLID